MSKHEIFALRKVCSETREKQKSFLSLFFFIFHYAF